MPRNKQKTNVAAVVVTYNRLALLKRCVGCLRGQTALCDILIVNNASTDGTEEWLAAQADLLSRNTGSNLGGAGGFNYGMRWAVEAEFDYVWVMDDDTLPKPDALEKLLEANGLLKGDYGWLSSVALWTDGSSLFISEERAPICQLKQGGIIRLWITALLYRPGMRKALLHPSWIPFSTRACSRKKS